jgi:putative hemolysin
MESIIFNALVIFVIILAAGLFSMSEIAVISARRSRIKQLAEQGSDGARHVEHLQANPDRFFATIQIGLTVMQSIASAIGGALAIEYLKPALAPLLARAPFPAIQHAAEGLRSRSSWWPSPTSR